MKAFGVLCAFALFLLMVAAPAGYAQDRDDSKPQAQEAPKPQNEKAAKPDTKAQQDDRAKQDDNAKQDDKAQQKEQEKEQKQQAKENEKAQKEQARNAKNQDRDQHTDNRQMDNRQMHPADNRQEMGNNQNHPAADRGRHIPDDQFRAHFGRQHTFHVQRTEVVNVSQPVVVYGGYSFQLVDAWPADWGFDDDCYVDYVDGEYFLFDVMHPGVRIAVFVVG